MPRQRPTRGGYRAPAKPAPVSGPGRLSRRTDSQPTRLPSGQPYGARSALQAVQQGAPMSAGQPAPAATPVPATTPGPAPGTRSPAQSLPSVFRSTERPNEPITAGIPFGPGSSGSTPDAELTDPDLILAAMARVLPHQEIFRLMVSGHMPQGRVRG